MQAVLVALAVVAAAPSFPSGRSVAPRAAGVVTGVLRYKGCASSPAGAAVSVIGRDATGATDADGRFTLTLPPGTYSLVIGGPGLVSDQRLDDVLVTGSQTRDLGTVEVWPEEHVVGCVQESPPAPASGAVVATAPDMPALDLPGATVAPTAPTPDQLWLRGTGGDGPGQFGLQGNPAHDDEDALGPPSFAIGPQGSLWVLDALNGRVERFDGRGRATSTFSIPRHGSEPMVEADIAVAEDGHVFLFSAGDPPVLTEHEPTGRILVGGSLPPSFKGVDLLFAGRQRPVFVMQNGQAVRAELGWGGVRAEGPLPGLPVGNLFVHVERLDRWRAAVKLSTADGRVKRNILLHSRVPITGVRLVGVDRRGEIVMAIDRAEGSDENTPRAEVLLLAIDHVGHLASAVSVPPGGRRYEFREFALTSDGVVVQMQSDTSEVRFIRWTLRPPPRDIASGEGLVRGRVVERGHPAGHLVVTIGRLRRNVPVAPDGTFEVRLSAGTWIISIRCGNGTPDAVPVDLKVAIAPGATVDLGTVTLVPLSPRPIAPVLQGSLLPGAAGDIAVVPDAARPQRANPAQ